ncbi:hypothetical protein N6H14_18850 [Paenibacillus sp. CC-CFT747]|nr:hypothetical protein N6H14_18850 [Paenibacillus sp. CC-CFT747]
MAVNIFLLLIALTAAFVEYRALWRGKKLREFGFSAGLFTVALLLNLLSLLHVDLPSPLSGIQMVFRPVSSLLDSMLK